MNGSARPGLSVRSPGGLGRGPSWHEHILKRLLQIPFPLLVVSVVVFLALPTRATRWRCSWAWRPRWRRLCAKLGLNAPLAVQYGRFLQHAVTGDFGTSLRFETGALPGPRAPERSRWPPSAVLATILGMTLGVLAASGAALLRPLLVSLGGAGQSSSFWLGILRSCSLPSI